MAIPGPRETGSISFGIARDARSPARSPRVLRTPAAILPAARCGTNRSPRGPNRGLPAVPGAVRLYGPAPFFPAGASSPASRSLKPMTSVALIPAYNEEAVIGEVVAGTLRQIENVIVVDDGSTDATADLAAAAGAEVVRLARNRGKAGAVMAGFAAALARGYEAVVMLDADGQHLPEEIPRVLAPVLSGEADMVVGSRFLEVRSEIPRYRVLGQKTLNLFTALGAGVTLTDTQSGFRALGPAALARLDFVSDGYSLESDMIAHFAACDLRIAEVPISCRYDVPNSHKKNPVLHGFEIVRAMSYAIVVRQRRALGVHRRADGRDGLAPRRRPGAAGPARVRRPGRRPRPPSSASSPRRGSF